MKILENTLRSHRKRVDILFTKFISSREIAKQEQNHLEKAEQFETDAIAAQDIAQNIAQQIQAQAHKQITGVVTNSLDAVFEEPYTFDIRFERKRGKTDAVLLFRRGELKVDPLSASGGGVVDIAAFALRLACLVLSCKPRMDRVLILDEPFKFVSKEFRERVRVMMGELSAQLGIQFIMVTHIDELETGKIIKLKKSQKECKKLTIGSEPVEESVRRFKKATRRSRKSC